MKKLLLSSLKKGFEMNDKRFVIASVCVLVGGVSWYALKSVNEFMHDHYALRDSVYRLEREKIEPRSHIDIPPIIIDKDLVTKSEIWRPIQEQVKNTVVQVFAQIASIDILQPYKAPGQQVASGSGFFINDEGELITNAHVVNEAYKVYIQIPQLGKRLIDVDVVGISERDVALLRVCPDDLAMIKRELGTVPFLTFGDSDYVRRSDEVLAMGYPLGQQSLKSTTGVISGREQSMIQISAPINPGSSGGPLLNTHGQVVGINTAMVAEAQNIGYIIPINDLKIILADLHNIKVLRTPFLGILYNNATEALTEYLGNPKPGGCYLVEVMKGSTLFKAGVQRGDMIYEINGHTVDMYGDMNVPWGEDKISIVDYVARLSVGQEVRFVVYRNGKRKEVKTAFSQSELPAIRKIYPGYESIDYEIIGGMVVMPLTLNHIHALAKIAPGLMRYAEGKNQSEQTLLITHIFPNSQLYRSRTITVGATLNEVNGTAVHTLDDLRKAVKSMSSNKFLTVRASDNFARTTDHIFVALQFDRLLEEEMRLAQDFKYPISSTIKELLHAKFSNKKLNARPLA